MATQSRAPNDSNAACAEQARKVHTWCEEQRKAGAVCLGEQSWPIASAAELVGDLDGLRIQLGRPELSATSRSRLSHLAVDVEAALARQRTVQ